MIVEPDSRSGLLCVVELAVILFTIISFFSCRFLSHHTHIHLNVFTIDFIYIYIYIYIYIHVYSLDGILTA